MAEEEEAEGSRRRARTLFLSFQNEKERVLS